MALTTVRPQGMGFNTGRRNLIINGAMQVAQRGTSAVTINSGSATYRLDRFYASGASSAGVYTVEQSTDAPANFKNSLKVTVTTADSSIGSTANYRVQQSLEGQNISHLNYGSSDAQTITLSFYVKSSLTGTFGGRLSNSALDRSYPYTYTISSANTWERKTVTIAGDTSGTWLDTNGIGIALVWSIGAGSSRLGTAGAWAGTRYDGASGQTNIIATNSSTWFITGVQLEVGSNASDFEHRSFGEELGLCQRYYEKSYRYSDAPGTVDIDSAVTFLANRNPGNPHYGLRFRTEKRADPTIVSYNPNDGTSGEMRNLDASTDDGATIDRIGTNGCTIRSDVGSTSLGNFMAFHYTSESEL